MQTRRLNQRIVLPAITTLTLCLSGPVWAQTSTEQLSKAIVDGVFGLFAKKPAAQASSPAADKVEGVVLATASPPQVSRGAMYPDYQNGIELLTKPDPDNTGVSELLRAGVSATYKNDPDIQSAAEHALKAKADSLEAVRLGKKVSDAQFYKYSVAEECMAQVVRRVTHLDTSEGFEWESTVFLIIKKVQPSPVVDHPMSYLSAKMGSPQPEVNHGDEQSAVPTGPVDARIL